MTDRPVRVRIAPSPTGEPHVGTAYIALFNLAFARKHGGKFVLRIEDTDRERSRPEWETQIMAGLRWLGLNWDEGPDVGGPHGPYRQSERKQIHFDHAMKLVETGHAYRCFCTKERLDQLREQQKVAKAAVQGYDRHCRDLDASTVQAKLAEGVPHVVRMKMPTGVVKFQDLLRGEVEKEAGDDQVLLKADGFATYHLANVVDDRLMQISHVIRAEEWISSTPKHVVLYQMFGWEQPVFVHMPLLRNNDKNKSKISKRKNPVSILDYRQRGYLPQAVINYLAMLGWSMPDAREVFSFHDFVSNFTFERMHLGGPTFDLDKLTWLNGKYYREQMTDAELADELHDRLFNKDYLARLVPLVKERINKAEDFIPLVDYFFSGEVVIKAEELLAKDMALPALHDALEAYTEKVDTLYDFSPAAIEAFSRAFAEEQKLEVKQLFPALRTAVSGKSATPPLFDTMSVLGRALVRRRLRHAVSVVKAALPPEPKKKG